MHSSKVYLKLNERLGLSDHSTVLNIMLRWGFMAGLPMAALPTDSLPSVQSVPLSSSLLCCLSDSCTAALLVHAHCSKIATNLKVFGSCEDVVEQTLTLFQVSWRRQRPHSVCACLGDAIGSSWSFIAAGHSMQPGSCWEPCIRSCLAICPRARVLRRDLKLRSHLPDPRPCPLLSRT